MATIIELHAQVMPRGAAHSAEDRTKDKEEMQPTPRWGLLYALGLVGVVLLIAGETLFGSAAARSVWDVAAAGVTLAAIKLWVQANRIALALGGRADMPTAAGADTTGTPARPAALPAGSKRAA
jgi:hypothetical protein